MILGIPKEIKNHETRVALTPEAVGVLITKGHEVILQRGAGQCSGFSDRAYLKTGAQIVNSLSKVYASAQVVIKVKEPLPEEFKLFRPGLILFCFLHLAANPPLVRALMRKGVSALAFETLQDAKGATPLLQPMSQVAGRLSTLLGAHFLRNDQGGKGVLLSPTDFSSPGRVAVIGGGNVGRAAAEVALGLGAEVWVLDRHPESLRQRKFSKKIKVLKSSPANLLRIFKKSDLVVGAVAVVGAKTPQVVNKKMIQAMEPGSVFMDVAIDQGGTSETTRVTSLSHPTYIKYGVIHCAVPNLPALAGRSATEALSKVLLPEVKRLLALGSMEKVLKNKRMRTAVNVYQGRIVHPTVARVF